MKFIVVLCALVRVASAVEPLMADCFGYYLDGSIFIRPGDPTGAPIPNLAKDRQFPLALYQKDWAADERLWFTLPLARSEGNAQWTVFKQVLYVDSSPGAYAPVGFKEPEDLQGGETDRYWGMSYGALWWAPEGNKADWTVTWAKYAHGGGFTHHPVEGLDGVMQLYWNQTQFEELVAGRFKGEPAPWFPLCRSGSIASISFKDHP